MELNERLRTRTRGHWTAAALLRAASADGHAALGWAGRGQPGAGALADFTTIALDSVRTAGPLPAARRRDGRIRGDRGGRTAHGRRRAGTSYGTGRHTLVPDVPQALARAVEALRA